MGSGARVAAERSAAAYERALELLPGGVNSPVRAFRAVGGTPRFIASARGPYLTDADGNEYVDALNGFGMSLFGWQPAFIAEAVHRQVDAGFDIGPQHPLAGEVAKLVCELTGFDRAGLCNTGSEAVMAALLHAVPVPV